MIIEVFPPDGGGKAVTTADVVMALKEAKVVFGVDLAAITGVVNESSRSPRSSAKATIAHGKAPVNGEAGGIEVRAVNLIPCPGALRRQQWMTKKDEVLLRLIDPGKGICGTNIFGGEIAAIMGKPATVEAGEGILFDPVDQAFKATLDGLAVFDGKSLQVRRQLIWSGDLTINNPPIQFEGSVTIRGTVRDGVRLSATEDIDISEGIEGASVISSGGSVFIKQGIAGHGRGYVSAKKLVDVNYVENGTVYCEGDILVRHAVLHSRLVAGNGITAQSGKGVIFGGDTRAGQSIKAKSFGNAAGIPTKLSVGHDWENLEKLQASEAAFASVRQQAAACEELIAKFRRAKPQLSQLSDAERQAFCSVLKRHVAIAARMQAEQKRHAELDSACCLSRGGEITCLETLYAGTCVKMGDATSMTSGNFTACQLHLSKEEQRIIAISPSGRKSYLS
jgi:uncharacterized protein (DUF342 family)